MPLTSIPLIPRRRDSKKLPIDLMQDIEKFQIKEFARQYFSQHKRGLIFKRKVPVEEMLKYQGSSLSKPLMVLAPNLKKEALKCWKFVQKIMSPKTDSVTTQGCIQQLIDKGIKLGGLRDEIFLQVIKVRKK
jgi:hypothetical protein